jgi:hypothetical protein
MAEGSTKFGEGSWVRVSTVIAILLGAGGLYQRLGSMDTRTAVLETNSDYANKQLEKIANSLEVLADRQDGEREKLGEHEGRIKILEQWRETVDRRLEGVK